MVVMSRMLSFDPTTLIDDLVEPRAWYRSRVVDRNDRLEIYLERVAQPVISVPALIYHATRRTNRDAIGTQGLARSSVGKTWMNRTYKLARIHFATNLQDLTFVESSETGGAAAVRLTSVGLGRLHDWNVYEFTVADENFHADVELDTAVWTAHPVPPKRLRRLDETELPTELRPRCGRDEPTKSLGRRPSDLLARQARLRASGRSRYLSDLSARHPGVWPAVHRRHPGASFPRRCAGPKIS